MKTDKIITNLRKAKGWSQADLANKNNISQVMVDKYERGETVPSIEAAKKIADALAVSLDYLVGEGINSKFDRKTVSRLQDLENLAPDDKTHVFALMDAFIENKKVKSILH